VRPLRSLRRLFRDPLLDADYVEAFQQGPKRGRSFSPGRYVKVAGVERDAIPYVPGAGGPTQNAGTLRTPTRWRG
jgi:hypothetical protein